MSSFLESSSFRASIAHRSPCGADPLGLKILSEARDGRLDTLVAELDAFLEGNWDQRAFYVSLAADNLQGKHALLVARQVEQRAPSVDCVRQVFRFLFGPSSASEPAFQPEHRLLVATQKPTFPESAVGRLVEGEWYIRRAWDARGSDVASTVSADACALFKERLEKARECLLKAAELDREDPTPFATLQTVAMGLPTVTRETSKFWLTKALKLDL